MGDNKITNDKKNLRSGCDHVRGISATLLFLFVLGALSSEKAITKAACIGAAGITVATALAIKAKQAEKS